LNVICSPPSQEGQGIVCDVPSLRKRDKALDMMCSTTSQEGQGAKLTTQVGEVCAQLTQADCRVFVAIELTSECLGLLDCSHHDLLHRRLDHDGRAPKRNCPRRQLSRIG